MIKVATTLVIKKSGQRNFQGIYLCYFMLKIGIEFEEDLAIQLHKKETKGHKRTNYSKQDKEGSEPKNAKSDISYNFNRLSGEMRGWVR